MTNNFITINLNAVDIQNNSFKLNNNTFIDISYQQGYSINIIKYILVLSNTQKCLQTELSNNIFKNIISCYGNDIIELSWLLDSNIISNYNSSILSNLPRIVDQVSYLQSPNVDLIIEGNSFEFVTFSENLIIIKGFSMIQFSSNTFQHIGFFSESLMRSVFPLMQNPISVWSEYTSDSLRSVQQTMVN